MNPIEKANLVLRDSIYNHPNMKFNLNNILDKKISNTNNEKTDY